ncbi:hypothetical protein [Bergeyella porcorum]|uniref:hypothetical protein n=1 Tax=Bergeyella porcorum TaxID=1735111 RepID=UPI002E1DF89A
MIKQILQFIFIMNFACMVAQTHRFVYKLDYQPDSLDVGSKKTEYFILTHSKTHSTFLSLNLHKRDSIASTLQKDLIEVRSRVLMLLRCPKRTLNTKS